MDSRQRFFQLAVRQTIGILVRDGKGNGTDANESAVLNLYSYPENPGNYFLFTGLWRHLTMTPRTLFVENTPSLRTKPCFPMQVNSWQYNCKWNRRKAM